MPVQITWLAPELFEDPEIFERWWREGIETPGQMLRSYMERYGLSVSELARAIHVPPIRISEIVRGKRRISVDTALRLGQFFYNTSPHMWRAAQLNYDLLQLFHAEGTAIAAEVRPHPTIRERDRLARGAPDEP